MIGLRKNGGQIWQMDENKYNRSMPTQTDQEIMSKLIIYIGDLELAGSKNKELIKYIVRHLKQAVEEWKQ